MGRSSRERSSLSREAFTCQPFLQREASVLGAAPASEVHGPCQNSALLWRAQSHEAFPCSSLKRGSVLRIRERLGVCGAVGV